MYARHLEIQEDAVKFLLTHQRSRGLAVVNRTNVRLKRSKNFLHQFEAGQVIFHDKELQ